MKISYSMMSLTVQIADLFESAESSRALAARALVKAFTTIRKREQYDDSEVIYESDLRTAYAWFSDRIVEATIGDTVSFVSDQVSQEEARETLLNVAEEISAAKAKENTFLDALRKEPSLKETIVAMDYDSAKQLYYHMLQSTREELSRLADRASGIHAAPVLVQEAR